MTTPVGSIRLDLKIDGSQLPNEVLGQIRTALEPTLAQLRRDLQQVQREYGQTTREAVKSGTAQASAARAAAEAVEDIGDEATKSAAKTQAAAGVSTRSINAQTRAWERQTAAILANTAARSANAAAPTGGPPAGGGRGSGGGGGRGGGGVFGDLFTGQGGGGRFLTSPAGLNLVALGIGSFPAAATAVTNLAGALQQLTQVGFVVPGVIAGIGASFGTATIGFQGMGDAIKALNEAAASGDPKDLEKATEALKHMAPAAVDTAKAVSGFISGPWKELQRNTAQTMFEGVDKTFTDLADKTMPTLTRGTAEVGSAWNKTFKELGRVGGLDSTQSFLDKIFGNTAEAQTRANAAIEPLVHGVGTLTAEGSDFLPRLGDGLTALTTRFDNFITKAAEDGRLDKWINEGIEGAKDLGETVLNIGKIFTDLTSAAGGDGGLLKMLREGSTALREWTSSAEGQEKLANFFREGREQIGQWIPVLRELWGILQQVYEASKTWTNFLLPVLSQILGAINAIPGGIEGVVLAFLAWRTISGVTSLLSALTRVGSLLDGLPGKARKAGAGVNAGLSGRGGRGGLLGPAIGAGMVLEGLTGDEPAKPRSGTDTALTIGGGALAGSAFGLPGAAIGAAGGAIADHIASNNRLSEALNQLKATMDQPTATGRIGQSAGLPLTAITEEAKKTADAEFRRQFFGANPSAVPEIPAKGTLQEQILIDAAERGDFKDIGVDGSNINAELDKVRENIDAAKSGLAQLGNAITTLPSGTVVLNDPTPEILDRVRDLGFDIEHLPNGQVAIDVNTDVADNKMKRFLDKWSQAVISPQISVPGQGTPGSNPLEVFAPRRADGGVLPGYSPGVDNILYPLAGGGWQPLSGGEGILIPEAVRGLGGSAGIYAINSMFRKGLSRRGYADGAVHLGTGALPGPPGDPVVALLTQIRDLLAGRANGAISDTAQATTTMAQSATSTTTGQQGQIGPFGTPLKPRNPLYEMAAAALSALGGDPEKFIGPDPTTFSTVPAAAGGLAAGGVPVDFGRYAAALSAFAQSGAVSDVTGLGLDANDPVVKAIAAARNKKKGGLEDAAIAGLIDQVLTGGGFAGTLDSSNTSLVSALQTFREKLAKGTGTTAAASTAAGATGLVPGVPVSGDAAGLIAFAQRASGGQYEWGASDLAQGLSDCSGAISDLVELMTKGQAGPERLFATNNAAEVLKSLGAVPGLVPGTLQIGFNEGHMAATLPNGVNFESGGGTGQGATYGGNAIGAGDPRFTQQWSLPVNGPIPMDAAAGMTTGLGTAGMGGVTPVFVTNWPGQAPGLPGLPGAVPGVPGMPGAPGTHLGTGAPPGPGNFPGASILQAGMGAAGGAASDVAGSLLSAILQGTNYPNLGTPTGQGTTLEGLIRERNPLAVANAFGFNVPDYTRQGGEGPVERDPNAPSFDSKGRMFSDTGTLIDRTMTDLQTQMKAQFDQTMAVFDEIKNRLGEEMLKPVMQQAITSGIEELSNRITAQIGQSIGQAAGPIIADAVRAAIPTQAGAPAPAGGGGLGGGSLAIPIPKLFDEGGIMPHATTGINLSGHPERVLNPTETRLFDAGLLGGWNLQPQQQHFATVPGVIGNDTVGADFFGVSQIPIIGAIVNLLVRVLLKMIGVEIEVRDTLDEMSDSVRQFRGDFQKFDASGRLMNDTSGLIDRSSTSEQAAADERIRILKIVIEALVKFIIEKIIIPIGKAVANAAIQAGASAAGAAINSQAPGAGGIVSSLISSAGMAGVDIGADLFGTFMSSLTPVLIDLVSEGLQSFFPDLTTAIFGGGLLEMLTSPITAFIDTITQGLGGGLAGIFGGLLGGLAFDQGGVATGVGFMPKATIAPERVLSPGQTAAFERLPDRLDRLITVLEERGGRPVDVGGIHLHGAQATPEHAVDRLMALVGGA